jgi:UDP-glucuronate 4-epimerase
MRLLVTGCAGFIGSNLIDKLLMMNFQVVGIDNFDKYYDRNIKESNLNSASKNINFKFFEIDIRNKNEFEIINQKFDFIIHLAAKAGVRPSLENPGEYISVNVLGTLNVIEFAKINGIENVIFASSSSVYGINDNLPWNEYDLDLKPISPYAITKISGELLGKTFSHLYNINFTSLRFFTVYGPRQRPDLAINSFFSKIINNEPITLFGDGSSIRDYTFVSDIINGICNLLNANLKGYNVYNFGSSNPIKLNDMIKSIENIVQKKAILKYTVNQIGDAPMTFSDSSKALIDLGFKSEIDFNQGIALYFKWLNEK